MLWFSLLQTSSIVGKINNAEQKKKSTEEVMGLFAERMYGMPVLTMLFVHSCTCSNKKSSCITLQKRTLPLAPFSSLHYAHACLPASVSGKTSRLPNIIA